MKLSSMTTSLKWATAFALFCLCIFLYSQQTSVTGSNAALVAEEECCKSCGTVNACYDGVEWEGGMAYTECKFRHVKGSGPACEVGGKYCICSRADDE